MLNDIPSDTRLNTVIARTSSLDLSRRNVLRGAGIGGAALLLASCSSYTGTPGPAEDVSDKQKTLRFDGRDNYRNSVGQDFPMLDSFTKLTKIEVTFNDAVSDDNVYYSKVKKQLSLGQDIGADAVVLSDWMAARWDRLGYLQDYEHGQIPNLDKVRDRFRDVASDPGRRFSMPWRSGFTGLAWNKSAIPGGLSAVSDLWDSSLAGKVGLMSSMRETIGSIMLDQGVDIEGKEWGDAEFTAAVNTLRDQVKKAQIGSIKGDAYLDDLMNGKSVAAIARSGDIRKLNAQSGDQWGFALPKAGGVLSSDNVVIPIGSRHKANVERFVNFYYTPLVAVEVAAATNFISPIELKDVDVAQIDPVVSGDVMVFPTPVTFETARRFRVLSQTDDLSYTAQYQTVLLGAS